MRAVASVGTRLLSCAFSRAKINRGHPGLLRLEKLPGRGGLCAPASRGASVPPGMTSFADASELSTFLSSAGVDVTEFGRGNAKTIADLFEEVEKGETVVDASEDGGVLRVVEVLNLYLMDGEGRVLMEEKQVLPSGHVRERGLVLSEKLVAGEPWQRACSRAVDEELGTALPPPSAAPYLRLRPGTYEVEVEVRDSPSYPGLASKYIRHKVQGEVPGLPAEERFMTTEERPEGVLENHWRWVPGGEVRDIPGGKK